MTEQLIKIGVIGDFDENRQSHRATNDAIRYSAECLSVKAMVDWLPTPSFLTGQSLRKLEQFDGLWASPGSPYRNMEGAIQAIRAAREMDRPFIGT